MPPTLCFNEKQLGPLDPKPLDVQPAIPSAQDDVNRYERLLRRALTERHRPFLRGRKEVAPLPTGSPGPLSFSVGLPILGLLYVGLLNFYLIEI